MNSTESLIETQRQLAKLDASASYEFAVLDTELARRKHQANIEYCADMAASRKDGA